MPSFKCTDIGMACPFTTSAKTEDELMKKIAEHVAKAHDMKTIPPEVMVKIKKALRNRTYWIAGNTPNPPSFHFKKRILWYRIDLIINL